MDSAMLLIIALLALLIYHTGLSIRAPRLMDVAKSINEEGLRIDGASPYFSANSAQYRNDQLSIIYSKSNENGSVTELLDMRHTGYRGGYRIWFRDGQIKRFEKSMAPARPTEQDTYYAQIILGKLQQAEALRG